MKALTLVFSTALCLAAFPAFAGAAAVPNNSSRWPSQRHQQEGRPFRARAGRAACG